MVRPWNDRAGRFSALRCVALAGAVAPALWLAWLAASGGLGPRPLNAATHFTGLWAFRFLLMSLAVTPLRRMGIVPRLIIVRRLLGLTALAYGLLHLGLHGVDVGGVWRTVTEIALRWYLLIGFVALCGLVALGLTSTDAAIRRMGARWHRLHRLVYPLALLGLLHFFLQSKISVDEPVVMLGILLFLLGARVAQARGRALSAPLVPLVLGVAAALCAAGLEAGWYGLATGADPLRVLAANLDFRWSVRPAWWVLAACAAPVVLMLLGRLPFRGWRPA